MGERHADQAAQPSDHDAEDQSGDPAERRTSLGSCGAQRDDGANRLEMAQARQRCRSQPYAAPSPDGTDTSSKGRCGGVAQDASDLAR